MMVGVESDEIDWQFIVDGYREQLAIATDLLQDARYHGADPKHARTWGRNRRLFVDRMIGWKVWPKGD